MDILKKKYKYLIFDDSVNVKRALLKEYAEIWDGIKNEMKAINGGKEKNMEKSTLKLNLILTMTCH